MTVCIVQPQTCRVPRERECAIQLRFAIEAARFRSKAARPERWPPAVSDLRVFLATAGVQSPAGFQRRARLISCAHLHVPCSAVKHLQRAFSGPAPRQTGHCTCDLVVKMLLSVCSTQINGSSAGSEHRFH